MFTTEFFDGTFDPAKFQDVKKKIVYSHTDEGPMLATYSFLPIVKAFTDAAGVTVETRDISLSGRVLAYFKDSLTPEQHVSYFCSINLISATIYFQLHDRDPACVCGVEMPVQLIYK